MRWRVAGRSETARFLAWALLGAGLWCRAAAGAESAACTEPKDGALPDVALEDVASGFKKPVHVASSGPGDDRLYVVEQAGNEVAVVDQFRGGNRQLGIRAQDVGDRAVNVVGIDRPLGRVFGPDADSYWSHWALPISHR